MGSLLLNLVPFLYEGHGWFALGKQIPMWEQSYMYYMLLFQGQWLHKESVS